MLLSSRASSGLQPAHGLQRAPLRCAQFRQSFRPTARKAVDTVLDKDVEKEKSRAYRRTVFDSDLWAAHRSTRRYSRHIRSIFYSRIARGLAEPLSYAVSLSVLTCCYQTLLLDGLLPELPYGLAWPSLAVEFTGPFSISTFALSLLLVFRTNTSYQRWAEARKVWGGIINRCRDLARQALQWVPESQPDARAAICRWVRAFPVALMFQLRDDHVLQEDLETVLLPAELALLLRQPHASTAVLQALGACVRASGASEIQKLRMDESIATLQDDLGSCERIYRTPIPLSYTRHTSRFLTCWMTVLPFCTWDKLHWLVVPSGAIMAFFLFGIEEIGVQIEEPFGILALEAFCGTISKNVRQMEAAAAAMQQLGRQAAAGSPAAAAASAAASATEPALAMMSAGGVELLPSMPSGAGSGSSQAVAAGLVSGGYELPRLPDTVTHMERGILATESLDIRGSWEDTADQCGSWEDDEVLV